MHLGFFLNNHSLQSCFEVARGNPAGQMKPKLKTAALKTHRKTEAYFVPVMDVTGHVNRSCADVLVILFGENSEWLNR